MVQQEETEASHLRIGMAKRRHLYGGNGNLLAQQRAALLRKRGPSVDEIGRDFDVRPSHRVRSAVRQLTSHTRSHTRRTAHALRVSCKDEPSPPPCTAVQSDQAWTRPVARLCPSHRAWVPAGWPLPPACPIRQASSISLIPPTAIQSRSADKLGTGPAHASAQADCLTKDLHHG